MKPIKIIGDSLSDIPKELAVKYNISILPLTIRFGDEEYKDGIDLNPTQFFQKLKSAPETPSTSQVPPHDFLVEIENALNSGYEVIVINGSSGVSGTHQSAMMAKMQRESDDITVVDTHALSYACGMIVVEAARMAQAGKAKKDILERIEDMKGRVDHLFSVETLEYLKKGGRLSPAKAAIGTILNVKPILTIEDGKVENLDKVRGSKKIIPRMIELAKERGIQKGCEIIGLAHGDNAEGLELLKEEVMKEFEPRELVTTNIGCTIGTHTGPGILALLYLKG
ncbi:MAG: fatty acid-binding protein DegV [Anaerosolibacter sp.]|jgi:DegV family protein with EDD domain|uniref:DegV family protein n=1 Tax=Anaerosolibacter sp. TaxID=1872527 RepID=UPI002602BF40|nr:DegV family protein [Anaerosolibacter sp.]MDF2546298.1 fatty acid-binding protein DegV [Anaerosolibacter sp.]